MEMVKIVFTRRYSKMKIVFTPDWFLTGDVLIDIFSFVTLCLIFILAFKSYSLSKKKGTLYIGLGFLLIALAELASILTKFVLYYDTSVTQEIGNAIITYEIVRSVDFFYYAGFFFSRLLMLLGFYTIYKLPLKRVSGEFFLYIYFITIISFLSQPYYYIYHFTALVLLVFLINKYYRIYLKDKRINTKILVTSFALLAIGQTVFLFSKLSYIYVIGQSIQLISYIILLMLIIRIVKDGKKEKQNRNHA